MTYELQVERAAQRQIRRLPQEAFRRVEAVIDALAHEPRPRGAKKLRGSADLLRIRVGTYRVIYAVFDRERLVKIVRVVRRTTTTYEELS
jgi:mRNA interferase RelE/StbE